MLFQRSLLERFHCVATIVVTTFTELKLVVMFGGVGEVKLVYGEYVKTVTRI